MFLKQLKKRGGFPFALLLPDICDFFGFLELHSSLLSFFSLTTFFFLSSGKYGLQPEHHSQHILYITYLSSAEPVSSPINAANSLQFIHPIT